MKKEAIEQSQLMKWACFEAGKYPELTLLFHIPNGGSRNKIEAANLKKQGVKAGVPDLCLPVPKGKYHGLFIEMKAGKNKATEKQKEWLNNLRKQGYCTALCYGFEEACDVILKYLKGEKFV